MASSRNLGVCLTIIYAYWGYIASTHWTALSTRIKYTHCVAVFQCEYVCFASCWLLVAGCL